MTELDVVQIGPALGLPSSFKTRAATALRIKPRLLRASASTSSSVFILPAVTAFPSIPYHAAFCICGNSLFGFSAESSMHNVAFAGECWLAKIRELRSRSGLGRNTARGSGSLNRFSPLGCVLLARARGSTKRDRAKRACGQILLSHTNYRAGRGAPGGRPSYNSSLKIQTNIAEGVAHKLHRLWDRVQHPACGLLDNASRNFVFG
jgi:hypothetical protein